MSDTPLYDETVREWAYEHPGMTRDHLQRVSVAYYAVRPSEKLPWVRVSVMPWGSIKRAESL